MSQEDARCPYCGMDLTERRKKSIVDRKRRFESILLKLEPGISKYKLHRKLRAAHLYSQSIKTLERDLEELEQMGKIKIKKTIGGRSGSSTKIYAI